VTNPNPTDLKYKIRIQRIRIVVGSVTSLTLSRGGGPENMYYTGYRCPCRKGHFWGVWPIEKHCKAQDLGIGQTGEQCKNGWTDLTFYMSCDVFLCKELLFGGHDNCTWVKIFSGISILTVVNFLTC